MTKVSLWWLCLIVTEIIHLVDANWITGNLCWSMPCMNGGSCFGSAYTYLCICPINYSGILCENKIGACQENPCGNRGLCIEKGLTSFECRCYFDYTGPRCEKLVSKNDANIWSSLLPVHTRVLFDMLQEAYYARVKGKSTIGSDQIDFMDLLTTDKSTSTTSMPMTSTTIHTTQREKSKIEHIIHAQDIQLEKIFADKSTKSSSDRKLYEFIEQLDYPTTVLSYPETDMTTATIEQIQPASLNATEEQEISNSSSTHNIIYNQTTQNLIEKNTESVIITTTNPTDITSTINLNDNFYPLDETTTSFINTSEQPSSNNTTTISQVLHNQILYNLCQKILSNILPNISSSSSATAVLSLISKSSSIDNKTTNVLLSWLNEHFNSSTSTPTTSPISSSSSSIELQRIDMDDVLYQMNNNNNENENL